MDKHAACPFTLADEEPPAWRIIRIVLRRRLYYSPAFGTFWTTIMYILYPHRGMNSQLGGAPTNWDHGMPSSGATYLPPTHQTGRYTYK